jgi:hypothetical protein
MKMYMICVGCRGVLRDLKKNAFFSSWKNNKPILFTPQEFRGTTINQSKTNVVFVRNMVEYSVPSSGVRVLNH